MATSSGPDGWPTPFDACHTARAAQHRPLEAVLSSPGWRTDGLLVKDWRQARILESRPMSSSHRNITNQSGVQHKTSRSHTSGQQPNSVQLGMSSHFRTPLPECQNVYPISDLFVSISLLLDYLLGCLVLPLLESFIIIFWI